jgi:hypothetical protein
MVAKQIYIARDPINGHESHEAIYTAVVMVLETMFPMTDRVIPATLGVTLLLQPSYKTNHNTFYSSNISQVAVLDQNTAHAVRRSNNQTT